MPRPASRCSFLPAPAPPLQPDYYPHGSGLPRGCRVSVLRKDLYDLIGKDPKLPLEVVLRISIQGVVQAGEQRVRWGDGFLLWGIKAEKLRWSMKMELAIHLPFQCSATSPSL